MLLDAPRLEMNGEALIDEALAPNRFSFEQLSEDLRACVSEQELVRLVENSVERVTRCIDGRDYTRVREVLLGVVTYFYAIGVYGSDEIASALATNLNGDSLHAIAFDNAEPSVVIRRFRRAHRASLENCLCDVLKAVCPGGSEGDAGMEANRRVINAIQVDSCALDL